MPFYKGRQLITLEEYQEGCTPFGQWGGVFSRNEWERRGFAVLAGQEPSFYLDNEGHKIPLWNSEQVSKASQPLIWWLTADQVRIICSSPINHLPSHIKAPLETLLITVQRDRPIKGWVQAQVGVTYDQSVLARLAHHCAGIEITVTDLPLIRQLGGFVTTPTLQGV